MRSEEIEPREAVDSRGILFVCTANICRSSMAVEIFNALAQDRGLAWRALGAGVSALEGEGMAPKARTVLEEMGIPVGAHRAKQVDREILAKADLVIAMSREHVAWLHESFGEIPGGVRTMTQYGNGSTGDEGIPDHYGLTLGAYRACARQLLGHIDGLIEGLRE